MAITGKTGADAIFKAIKRICIVLTHYRVKFVAVTSAAQTAGVITEEQAVLINDFIGTSALLCAALEALAGYSGF